MRQGGGRPEGMTRTVLDRVPKGGGVLLGEAHDLLCVAVAHEVCLFGKAAQSYGQPRPSQFVDNPLDGTWTGPGSAWSGHRPPPITHGPVHVWGPAG